MIRALPDHMRGAMENDTDLLAEVQSFWNEPASHVSLWSEDETHWLAVSVLQWLQVRPIASTLYKPMSRYQ